MAQLLLINTTNGNVGVGKTVVPKGKHITVDLRLVQFRKDAIESLVHLMQKGQLRVLLDNVEQTPEQVLTLKYRDVSEPVRTDHWVSSKKIAPPSPELGRGVAYTGLDGNPHFRKDDGTDLNLGLAGGAPMSWKGSIANSNQFPDAGVPNTGWVYSIVAPCIDNNPAKTNTGQSFLAGDEIGWRGDVLPNHWELVQGIRKQTVVTNAMTPYDVLDSDQILLVDTAAGAVTLRLPSAVGRACKLYEFKDLGNATAKNVTIQAQPGEFIDGVPSFLIWLDRGYLAVESDGTNWQILSNQSELNYIRNVLGVIAVDLADINVRSTHPGLDLMTLGNKVSAALNGATSKRFTPGNVELIVTAVAGVPVGDAKIKVGTTNGGSEICASHSVPNLNAVGKPASMLLEGDFPVIPADSTIWVEVSQADSSVVPGTAITVIARVRGTQVTP